jgi:DNA-binding MarR family transcriptional regulator
MSARAGSDPTDRMASLSERIRALGNDLRYNLAFHVLYTGVLMDKYLESETRKLGSGRSRAQLRVLFVLVIHAGRLRPSELASMLMVSKQTVGGLIDALEREGLIVRESTAEDRRARAVRITDAGVQLVEEMLPHSMSVAATAMPPLGGTERAQLADTLRGIRRHLVRAMKERAA